MQNENFLKAMFRKYYQTEDIILPPRFNRREYGFMFFDKNFMLRHLGFRTKQSLKKFLIEQVPKHAYYSTAYYSNPSARSMEDKGWLGADLIFDLDADHIPETEGLEYHEMLKVVKKEAEKLIFSFLLDDFGFSEKDLFITFSGGRGYHIYVRNPAVFDLKSDQRREIVTYITGEGADLEKFLIEKWDKPKKAKKYRKIYELYPSDYGGWFGKVRKGIDIESKKLLDIYMEYGELALYKEIFSVLKDKKLAKKLVKALLKKNKNGTTKIETIALDNRSHKLQDFSNDIERDIFLQYIKEKIRIRGEADEPVTTDIHRLIRLVGSLHGKTGFIVKPLTLNEFKDFNPFKNAIPSIFKEKECTIILKEKKEVIFDNKRYVLDGEEKVPLYVAIFLIARGFADFLSLK